MLCDDRPRRQRRKQAVAALALLLVLAALLPGSSYAKPAGPAIVRTDPPVAQVAVNGTVTVNLYIQDVVSMYGADVRFTFDPEIIQVVDAQPGTAGIQITPLSSFLKPDYVVRKKACNGADPADPECTGGLVWYASTQVNPSQPVTGSGPIASVTFRRIKEGDATLTWIYSKVVEKTGATIPSETQNGLVTTGTVTQRFLYLPMTMR